MAKDLFIICTKLNDVWYTWAWSDERVPMKTLKRTLKPKLKKGEEIYCLDYWRFYDTKSDCKKDLSNFWT